VAEETGLINQIGEWILRQACLEAATWPDNIAVAVNLSPLQFKSNGLAPAIIGALAASAANAELERQATDRARTVIRCFIGSPWSGCTGA